MLTTRKKKAIIQDNQKSAVDTGSVGVQVAMLTKRIEELTDHLKKNKKDHHSRVGLIGLVSDRRKHLKYLKKKDFKEYEALINKLGLKR